MQRLKEYLEDEDMTQAELADMMGVSQPTVWEWVHGVSYPAAPNLKKLSRKTGLSIDELLGSCHS